MEERDEKALLAQKKQDLSEAGIDLEGVRRLSKRILGAIPAERLRELSDEGQVETTVAVDLTATYNAADNEGLLKIHGTLGCTVRQVCARCLVDFSTPQQVEVERLFAPGPDPAEPDSQQEMVEELTYLPDYRLNIVQVVEEELLLALPMIPLCQPDCLGLCPGCGVDLNKESCLCVAATPEGPFAVLKKLKMV
ncbi:MAG: DUF177 domain-containing protein [Magnetococcus sp. YQC-3]